MRQIFKNVTILHKNGVKKIYDAIYIAKKGVYTGQVIIKTKGQKEFEDHGFIPHDQIQRIMVCNRQGKSKDIDL